MPKSSLWLITYHLNLVNPLHIFNVQDMDLVVVCLILEIRRAKVPSEEHHKALKKHAGLFLNFLRIFTLDVRHCHPFFFRNVKGVIVLQNRGAVSPKNDKLVAIVHHIMKSTTFRQSLL